MRPITDILREYRKGRGVDHASRLLNEVVRSVIETGKKGEVTIKLTVKPPKEEGSNEVGLVLGVTSKRPEPTIPDAVFFADRDGDLHRSDPAQKEMPFRDAAGTGSGERSAVS